MMDYNKQVKGNLTSVMSKLVFSNKSGIIYILWDITRILINLEC